MRAYSYFAMAKRYGGVPIILEAQNPNTTPEDEYFPVQEIPNRKCMIRSWKIRKWLSIYYLIDGPTKRAGLENGLPKRSNPERPYMRAVLQNMVQLQLDGLVGIPHFQQQTAYYELLFGSFK
jgi:hypothetical protein